MARELPQYVSQLSIGSLPKVQYSNAQAEFTQGVSQQMGALANNMEQKAAEIESLNASSTLRTELYRMSEEAQNNPELLKQKIQGFKTGFIKGIKNQELAAKFAATYDATALPYIDKATDGYNKILDQEKEVAAIKHIEASIRGVKDLAPGLISDIPERVDSANRSMESIIGEVSNTVSMRRHDGSYMFSPLQQEAYIERARKEIEGRIDKARLAPIEQELIQNPAGLIEKINSGQLDGKFKDVKEKEKYLKESIAKFKDNEERGQILRVVDAAVKDQDIYSQFVNNAPDILDKIENYKNDGGNAELADYMRKQALKANPVSASDQDQIYTSIIDEVNQLKITTKQGKVKIGKDDATLEDVTRLQQKIMKASIRGVTGLDSQLKKLSPAILELAKKERGKDDLGIDSFFGFFRTTEAYDPGYEVIQSYLEKQDKEEDYATKAGMMREFINRADQIPEDIQKDDQLFQQAQEKIAQAVIAGQANKGMKNIPTSAIQHLLANPDLAPQFDELFGVGAAARILGR